MGLIFSLLWVYELMLIAQVTETGITGIVLSLLPSLPLSALHMHGMACEEKDSENSDQ